MRWVSFRFQGIEQEEQEQEEDAAERKLNGKSLSRHHGVSSFSSSSSSAGCGLFLLQFFYFYTFVCAYFSSFLLLSSPLQNRLMYIRYIFICTVPHVSFRRVLTAEQSAKLKRRRIRSTDSSGMLCNGQASIGIAWYPL